jgi:hypothetical protein
MAGQASLLRYVGGGAVWEPRTGCLGLADILLSVVNLPR